jgi:hypothetical protein
LGSPGKFDLSQNHLPRVPIAEPKEKNNKQPSAIARTNTQRLLSREIRTSCHRMRCRNHKIGASGEQVPVPTTACARQDWRRFKGKSGIFQEKIGCCFAAN